LLGVIFYDIGNVYGNEESWQFSRYKHSTGAGIRWLSPMGPLRLEWGLNLDPLEDEDNSNWEFSIGGNF
ncbi:MAG TPA: BamA/TamA family outer membrane protein, partial [Desulfurivibrionaceae bacterium]|nr:BamA/TamA family outer membrane protein [Desulfurivibrionaceae bacterium]